MRKSEQLMKTDFLLTSQIYRQCWVYSHVGGNFYQIIFQE
jgi:hypothetical protein